MPYGYMNQLPPRLPPKQRFLNNRYVDFFRNFDVALTIRALLFTVVAAIVIGIFVLSLQIERFIKFLSRFYALFVWTFLIVGSWAVVVGFTLLIISLV